MKWNKQRSLVILLSIVVLLAACSSGGGGGSSSVTTTPTNTTTTGNASLSALVVATKVSVVDAQPTTTAKPGFIKSLLLGITQLDLSSTSDYNKDKTEVYVSERSADALETLNDILCITGQTKYGEMLNKGDYIALADENQCGGKSSAQNAGQDAQNQSSSANMPSYWSITVNSSRQDNNSPEIVKLWIHKPASDKDPVAMMIYGNMTITEGKSDTNPYGIFSLNLSAYPVINGVVDSSSTVFKATLKSEKDSTGKVILKFVSDEDHSCGTGCTETGGQKIAIDRQPDGSGGAGHIYETYTNPNGTQTSDFDIAFNTSYFYRLDPNSGSNVCLNRTNFDQSAWSYGLYDSNGARVNRNSGFSITFGPNGNDYRGYIGYWGVWTENNASLSGVTTVNKVDYTNGTSTSTPYSLFTSGGKLHKHTRKSMTLGDIKGVTLNYYEQAMSSPTGTNYEVVWDGTNFNKIAYMPQNCMNNCTWANITSTPTPTIDVTNLSWGTLNFWSQSGQIQVALTGCTYVSSMTGGSGYTTCSLPDNTLPVIYYADDLVYPGDTTVPTSLACYDQCPQATDSTGINPDDPYGTMNSMTSGPSTTQYPYSFIPNRLMLQENGFDLVETTTGTNSMYQWGVNSGPIFEPSTSNMALLDCNWDGDNNPTTQPQVCSWKAWSVLPVFYTWETGPNTWNQFVSVMNSNGAVVEFDAPLDVKYVDSTGATYLLQYGGFGQLNGIPGKCVNLDTGADADCSTSMNNDSIRWVPQFSILATDSTGNLTTVAATDPADSSNTSSTYYVKPLQLEQRMTAADSSNCSFAPTDFSIYTLPDISIWQDPQIADGTEPALTSAPAVIGGVVQ